MPPRSFRTYSKGNVGKMLGIGLGIGGLLLMSDGRLGLVVTPPSMRPYSPRLLSLLKPVPRVALTTDATPLCPWGA
jgi:hypothetical protein